MSDVTSRFQIVESTGSVDYDYQADVVRVQWEVDRSDFARVDLVRETDVRSYMAVISFESVLVSQNSNSSDVSAAELYEKIRKWRGQGNRVEFFPDISASAPNSATPSVEIVTDGPPPTSYSLEQGGERLRRSLTVKSKRWLDPSDTTAGGDKEVIDDLNSLDTTI